MAEVSEVVLFGFKPQLVVPGMRADAAVQFYKAAFGAEEVRRVAHSKRKADQELPPILYAELKIGSSILIVSDRVDEAGEDGMATTGGIVLLLEVKDVDATLKKAVAAGAEVVSELSEDEGGLVGKVKDPYGVVWTITAVVKETTEAAP